MSSIVSSKKFTSKGTLRQVFNRVYKLENGDTVSHDGIFDPAPCELLPPLTFPLVSSPLPLPCVNKYTVYTYTVCKGGGGSMGSLEGRGPQTDKISAAKDKFF
jgi:hypothetical protein